MSVQHWKPGDPGFTFISRLVSGEERAILGDKGLFVGVWTEPTEKLPVFNELVLVTDGFRVMEARFVPYYDHKAKRATWEVRDTTGTKLPKVLAWMSRPEPNMLKWINKELKDGKEMQSPEPKAIADGGDVLPSLPDDP